MLDDDAGRKGPRPARRAILKALAALPLLSLAPRVARAAPTPSATEGPFYPKPDMRFPDQDNDLVRIVGVRRSARGSVMMVRGRVLARDGTPAHGARIEIWQCDANGRYLHTGDRFRLARRDNGFQGYGSFVTGRDGAYLFRTIQPVPYPGRAAPHIHVRVTHADTVLTTQLYIAGFKGNRKDRIFRRMTVQEQDAVSMRIGQGPQSLETTVNIRL